MFDFHLLSFFEYFKFYVRIWIPHFISYRLFKSFFLATFSSLFCANQPVESSDKENWPTVNWSKKLADNILFLKSD